jgi:UDP-N-acetylglucosamine 4-epimerase
MDRFPTLEAELRAQPQKWLVTGAAGFIGSHLVDTLLQLGQGVVGLDDFSTGRRSNLARVLGRPGVDPARFRLIEGDLRDRDACARACDGVDRVLHQAALGSVPRSIEQPLLSLAVNVDGFVNIALAAVAAGVKGFSYASSSSVFGDSERLPKREGEEGRVLSPYAASKRMDEVAAESFATAYQLPAVGLRYFNVVGPRQDPDGVYAAVVPRWLATLADGKAPIIFGDGLTSRDFCPVENVVRANLLAATAGPAAWGRAVNVGLGGRTTLLDLYRILRDGMAARGAPCAGLEPTFEAFRKGDVRHSLADVSLAQELLGWAPSVGLDEGLGRAMDAFVAGEV